MEFRKRIEKLLGLKTLPATPAVAAKLPYFDDPAGYYTVRGEAFGDAYNAWRRNTSISPAQLQTLAPGAIAANLDNRSGYVREFCLRALTALDETDAFQAVIRRLNDYVDSNRALALVLVLRWLDVLPVAQLIEALPEFAALAERRRVDRSRVQEAVQCKLDSEEGRQALMAATSHTRARVRQVAWRWCAQTMVWTDVQKINLALRSGDPAIARSVEPAVLELPEAALLSMFATVHQIRAMPIRRAVFTAVRRRALLDDAALVPAALWDTSFAIRWMARFWSKDRPDFLVQQYQDALHGSQGSRRKRFALEGLAELKSADTLALCVAALQDQEASVRRAALVAACSIDRNCLLRYGPAALMDPALPVVRQVFRTSVALGEPLFIDVLQAAASARNSELPFFILLLECARQFSLWPSMHMASLTRLAAPALQAALQPVVDKFLAGLGLAEVYVAPNARQWEAISQWLPMGALHPQSDLYFVMNIYAKRMLVGGHMK